MKQLLKIIGAVFFGTITLLLTKIAIRRLTWDYEKNGHFNEATSTNYSVIMEASMVYWPWFFLFRR
jgi:hypothetical protein